MANACFIIFDLSNENRLKGINSWIESIKEYSENIKFIILGNKNDLKNKISDDIIDNELEKFKDIIFMRVSAAENSNIKNAIERLLDLIENDNEDESTLNSLNKNNTINKKMNLEKKKSDGACC